jgi:GntR family transcriptional regulator, transcriptional repressor for pyruvate dehydrogenase complex
MAGAVKAVKASNADAGRGGVVPKVLERIRRLIAERGLLPGMKLPAERQLAMCLGVGRPAVREAIKALSMLGLIESRGRGGTYVSSDVIEPRRFRAPGKFASHYDLIELLEVRRMLEPRAAALAASRAGEAQLREIEQAVLAQEASPDDWRVLDEHDYRFHEAIVQATGNRVLRDIYRALSGSLRKSRILTARTTPDIARVVGQHRMIFNGIRMRLPELAKRAMADHLETTALDLISERRR